MTSRRLLAAVIGLGALLILAGLSLRHTTAPESASPAPLAPVAPVNSAPARETMAPETRPAGAAADPGRSELADTLNSPAQDIHADLRVLGQIFDVYRSNFPHDGNPVGNNAEITAVLTGDNIYHVAFIPRDHPAINARGELCDRWGKPFFFHQLSAARMEIRSAGPDKKFWTPDDVVLTP